MEEQKPVVYDGVVAVGLLALHDRAFFERLIATPRSAVAAEVDSGRLSVTDAEIDRVVALIEARMKTPGVGNALEMWDKWKTIGEWERSDWPRAWADLHILRGL